MILKDTSKSKNILVTGGAGFIGSHVVVQLTRSGYNPIIIDNFSNSDKSVINGIESITSRKVNLREGDCTSVDFLNKVFEETEPIGVVHFAAYKAVGESVEQPLKYYENNIGSTIALLNTMARHKCPNLVFSSSCTVYGSPDQLPVDENAPIKPAESPYGFTKQVCEQIIQDQTNSNQSLSAISLRYFNPIGADPSGHIGELPLGIPSNLVPFITQTAAGLRSELIVHGDDYPTADGSCIRDYIHVVDLANAHIKALEYLEAKSSYYDVFNVGSGKGHSVLEVINAFSKVTGHAVPYQIGPRRAGDVTQVYASVNKVTKVLRWTAQESLETALLDAWRWQQTLSEK